jgi:hypothetical protein
MLLKTDPQWWHRFFYRVSDSADRTVLRMLVSRRYITQIDVLNGLCFWAALMDETQPARWMRWILMRAIDALQSARAGAAGNVQPHDIFSVNCFWRLGNIIPERTIITKPRRDMRAPVVSGLGPRHLYRP